MLEGGVKGWWEGLGKMANLTNKLSSSKLVGNKLEACTFVVGSRLLC